MWSRPGLSCVPNTLPGSSGSAECHKGVQTGDVSLRRVHAHHGHVEVKGVEHAPGILSALHPLNRGRAQVRPRALIGQLALDEAALRHAVGRIAVNDDCSRQSRQRAEPGFVQVPPQRVLGDQADARAQPYLDRVEL